MLELRMLETGYGPMQVLWGPDLVVDAGSMTSLLGPNGACKSALLWTILGAVLDHPVGRAERRRVARLGGSRLRHARKRDQGRGIAA